MVRPSLGDPDRHTCEVDARQADLLSKIDPVVLGSRVRAARLARAMTQADLAGAEVTVSYISRIEAGQRRPDGRVLARLADRLRVPLEQLLVGTGSTDVEAVQLAVDFVELALESGNAAEALTRADEVIEDAAAVDAAGQRSRVRHLRARALEGVGNLAAAIEELEQLAADSPDGLTPVPIGIALSRCYRETGDLPRAIQTGEDILARLAEDGLLGGDEAVQLTVTVAAAYFERGDTHHAVRLCTRAMSAADSSGSGPARAAAYWNASMMELKRGSVDGAVPLARRALALLGESSDSRNLARLRSQLGVMQLQLDPPDLEEAQTNLEEAAKGLASSSASTVDLWRNQVAIARHRLAAGEVDAARDLAAQVYEAARGTAPLLAADARAVEGQALAQRGEMAAASTAYREAVYLLSAVGSDRGAGQLWLDLGSLLEGVGDMEAARDAYRSAAVSSGLRVRSATPSPDQVAEATRTV